MDDEAAIERELNIWISLEHPSILPLRKIGRLNLRLAAIMQMCDKSLDDLVDERGALSEREVLSILGRTLDGLEYAWSQFRLLHLDVKPSNVLVISTLGEAAPELDVKITDWGISRLSAQNAIGRERGRESQGQTVYGAGTPLYMSPERISGQWTMTPSADIYSIGMMAVQLSTGSLPFRLQAVDPLQEIATLKYYENVAYLLAEKGKRFREFCLACLHPFATKRPQTFREAKRAAASAMRGIS
jgi:serine/threonine protein kinase